MPGFNYVYEGAWTPIAGAQMGLAVSTATSLTVPTGAEAAVIQAETGDVRYRDDGTAPTGSAGMVLAAASSLFYVNDLADFQAIESASSGGTLNVLYYARQQ